MNRKKNPDSEENITRVDKASSASGGSTHGFQVRFERGDKKYNKFFSDSNSDSKYGGKEGAREQARMYRDMAEPHVPEKLYRGSSQHSSHTRRSSNTRNKNNKSGVVGIHFQRKKKEDGSETLYVVAVAAPAPLRQISKYFRVGTRQIEDVMDEAVQWRQAVLDERFRKAKADKMAWRNALDDLIARGQKHLEHGEKIRVFLCHSKSDKDFVMELHGRLTALGCDPWLDEDKLLPGQIWEQEIPRPIKNSHVFLVCLSADSVTKRGFVQKEIRLALDVAETIPEGDIFIIPIQIQPCEVPEPLAKYQWLKAYSDGYGKLILSLAKQAKRLKLLPLRDQG